MSFFKNLVDRLPDNVGRVVERIPDGIHHARAEVIGRWNPNRRHDEPEEIENDRIRQEIIDSHRFKSFASERGGNFVKWHIDGHDYMWAVSEMIDRARDVILILDWWLTPELYLRRPPADHPEWRLDKLLKRKAEQGVRIYVVVYKEVTQTMSMSSKHTKSALSALHENIQCVRHPDHIGAKDSVEFWSHHEKVVVVDNHYAAIGGLDLCFGRWDTHNHPLADAHPTDFSRTLFPGQDYNNARIMDFQEVYNFASNTLSILESPRMPWHDVHMTLMGDVVLDIVQHFTERWNEIKKRKYRNRSDIDWLALPHSVEHAPNEAVNRHPHREQWREMGRHFKQRFHGHYPESGNEGDYSDYPGREYGTCRVQVVRSVSDWSHGVLTEHSIQNAYIELIQEAQHFIYIENQFFISATKEGGAVSNLIAKALVERIVRAAREGQRFKVIVTIPEVPGFAGNIKDESSVKTIMAAQYRTINRGGSSIYEEIRKAGYEPMDYIRFYHLRSYDRLNAPIASYIRQVEQASGVTFYQAQVALARLWVGDPSLTDQKEVRLKAVEPTTGGLLVSDKSQQNIEKVPIPENEDQARETIDRFERAARRIRSDEQVSDSVAQHMLRDRTSLQDEQWLGTEEEELQSYVSELLYIHSKVMIVDDRRVIMGSANLNDRSQKGDGDSEIAIVVEDEDLIDGQMNREPVKVARFAASLRRKLFREHLGLIKPQNCEEGEPILDFMLPAPTPNPDETHERHDAMVADPISDEVLRLWESTARKNREIFTEIFRPVPTNLVRSWSAYDDYVPKVKAGHVVPSVSLDRVKDRLAQVRGTLVECPLDFLIDQKDFAEGPEWLRINPTLPIYI